MSPQECADALNALLQEDGDEPLFNERYIRERVMDGELRILNPLKKPRQRYKISVKDFCAYAVKHHPRIGAALCRKFGVAA